MSSGNDYRNNPWYEYDGRKVYLVNTLFDGIARNASEVDCLAASPFTEDGFTIGFQDVYTLKDGMHVELCNWWMDGMTFWDLSIDKEEFDKSGNRDFLAYLDSIGVYLDSVLDRFAWQWRYCGVVTDDKVYRIQYYLENEDDEDLPRTVLS